MTAPLPLSHLKVLDVSQVMAGPFACMLLGDMGADVVKVEPPGVGDQTRRAMGFRLKGADSSRGALLIHGLAPGPLFIKNSPEIFWGVLGSMIIGNVLLIILNLPHPKCFMRELANNPEQQKNSQYARDFQKPDAAKKVPVDMLAFWVKEPEAKKIYIEAFKRSSMEGMLNYYKANYPRISPDDRDRPSTPPAAPAMPAVKCSVLLIHGLKDTALLPGALNDTWNWLDSDLTLVTIPNAVHFVQQDAAELVTRAMVAWLNR